MSTIERKALRLKSGDECVIRSAGPQDAGFLIEHMNVVGGETDFLTYGPGDVSLYESLGFQTEGRVSREYRIDGEFHDNVLMGLEL